ncbi:MAG: polysaccharide deacetylase [Haloarculaceae archaeon]
MADPTVCLTVDLDAVSPWLHLGDRNSPVNRSRGVFGAEVGAPRLLDLFDDHGVDATWFVPGHTVESFPEVVECIPAAGHAVEHHGWSHRRPGDYESRSAERADVERGIAAIEDLTGQRPTGYRSPSWDFSEHTVDVLVELGFEWDSSGMARDFEPYRLRRDDAPVDEPYDRGEPTDLVEIPVSWQRDDFPPLAFTGDRGFVDEAAVFRSWREQFDWMRESVDGGVYVLTMHPQVMGQGHRLQRLDDLLEHVADAGAEFATCGTVADRVG